MGTRRVPLATDKAAAQRLLNEMMAERRARDAKMLDRAAGGPVARSAPRRRPGSIAAGIQVSTGRKRRTAPGAKQVQMTAQRVRDVLDGCGFQWVDDLKNGTAADKLARNLRERMARPRNGTDRGSSAQTATFVLSDARRFARVDRPPGDGGAAGRVRLGRRVRPGQHCSARPPGRCRRTSCRGCWRRSGTRPGLPPEHDRVDRYHV